MARIVISQRVLTLPHGEVDALERAYCDYYSPFGLLLYPIPNFIGAAVDDFLTELAPAGVILSGGNDLGPRRQNNAASTVVPDSPSSISEERDASEARLLSYAIARNIPVLCQCRGMQFANVFFGGKIRPVSDHVAKDHHITLTASVETILVNSYHAWGITQPDLAACLDPRASAADGTIEAAVHQEKPILCVMWHPERASPDAEFNNRLVQRFVAALRNPAEQAKFTSAL